MTCCQPTAPPASFETLLQHMDRFNQDALALGGALAQDIEQSKGCCSRPSRRSCRTRSPPCRGPPVSCWNSTRWPMRSPATSPRRPSAHRRSLFVLVFAVGAVLQRLPLVPAREARRGGDVADKILHMPWLLVAFVGLFIYGSVVLHRRAAKGDFQNKYQDYRALAEGCGCSSFGRRGRRGLGRRPLPAQAARGTGVDSQRADVMGRRGAWRADRAARAGRGRAPDWLHSVRKHWVLEQRNYFKSKAQSGSRRRSRSRRTAHRGAPQREPRAHGTAGGRADPAAPAPRARARGVDAPGRDPGGARRRSCWRS